MHSSTRLKLLVVALAVVSIAGLRPGLAAAWARADRAAQAVPLPAPEVVQLGSLGYRAALADQLFVQVLVKFGIFLAERRRFEQAAGYLEAAVALDPTFREPYLYADTLIVMGATAAEQRHYEAARAILRRGVQALPYDAELWLVAGQYLALLAAPYMQGEQRKAWQLEGARFLARACELPSKNQNIAFHCMSAATLFSREGQREAAIRTLQHLLAVTDNPEVEAEAKASLMARLGERERDLYERRLRVFAARWRDDLPFVSRDLLLVLGPPTSAAACAGWEAAERAGCESTWRAWSEAQRQALGLTGGDW